MIQLGPGLFGVSAFIMRTPEVTRGKTYKEFDSFTFPKPIPEFNLEAGCSGTIVDIMKLGDETLLLLVDITVVDEGSGDIVRYGIVNVIVKRDGTIEQEEGVWDFT